MKYTVAVVFTFHNRKLKTIKCIDSLKSQECSNHYKLIFFACDDGSCDGTKDALLSAYDDINIVEGDGNLFWARGMAAACEIAKKAQPDFYLMVNDDVVFYPYAIKELFDTYEKKGRDTAVVGCTQGENGEWTYGGRRWKIQGLKVTGQVVLPTDDDLSCNVTNWNCFLIPRHIFQDVGDIDAFYEHSYADFDYSLRMEKKGFITYSTSRYIGICESNSIKGTWQDTSLPKMKRIKMMQRRTAKPLKSDIHFYKKIFGFKGLLLVIKEYIKILIK